MPGLQELIYKWDVGEGTLIIKRVALGLVLLIAAQLLMASFLRLVQRDPGFRVQRLLTFNVGLSASGYNKATLVAFCDRLLERLRALPGLDAAAMGMPLPLEGRQLSVTFDIEERPVAPPERPASDIAIVTPGYFGANINSVDIIVHGKEEETILPVVEAIETDALPRVSFRPPAAVAEEIKPLFRIPWKSKTTSNLFLLRSSMNFSISRRVIPILLGVLIPFAHLFLGNTMTSSISGWFSNKPLEGSSTTHAI
jgi:hypothetical protein